MKLGNVWVNLEEKDFKHVADELNIPEVRRGTYYELFLDLIEARKEALIVMTVYNIDYKQRKEALERDKNAWAKGSVYGTSTVNQYFTPAVRMFDSVSNLLGKGRDTDLSTRVIIAQKMVDAKLMNDAINEGDIEGYKILVNRKYFGDHANSLLLCEPSRAELLYVMRQVGVHADDRSEYYYDSIYRELLLWYLGYKTIGKASDAAVSRLVEKIDISEFPTVERMVQRINKVPHFAPISQPGNLAAYYMFDLLNYDTEGESLLKSAPLYDTYYKEVEE